MCYSRIRIQLVLATLIAVNGIESLYSYNELREIIKSLADAIPGYVTSDFSMKKIQDCIDEYPNLFGWVEQDGRIFVGARERKPKLEYFNFDYSLDYIEQVGEIATWYPSSIKRNGTEREISKKLEKGGLVDGIYLEDEETDQFKKTLSI